jgi:LPXTG-motif cell wall-anchored protein
MAGSIARSRKARLLLAGGLAAAGLTFVGGSAAPAGAVSVTPTCDAFLYNPDGSLPAAPSFADTTLPALDVPSLGGGTVETGTAFEITSSGSPVALPDAITNPLPATIVEIKNVTLKFQINGAASVGQPTLTGNSVNAIASTAGNVLTLNMRGSSSGSVHAPSGSFYFTGGSTFTPPTLKLPVTAPSAPGTITGKLTNLALDAVVAIAPGANTAAHVECPLDVAVGATTVVAPPPPPPGAPDAINDTAATPQGTPITIDVLANDVPDPQLPMDPGSIAITQEPGKGSVTITDDDEVVYTPAGDALGVDSFKYRVCSLVEASEGEEPPVPCDEATVSVTIFDPDASTPPTTGGSAPTTAAGPTTAAAAGTGAGGQLPRTGDASSALAVSGAALLGVGALALGWGRRRSAAAR